MKVSVVVPCHDAEPYLGQAIASVLEQSRPPNEILVVDDASRDGSRKVARGFGDSVRVLEVDFRSAPRARNHGFAAASGDALMFLDADDVLGPRALEALVEALEWTPGGVALCPWFRLDEEHGRWIPRPPPGRRHARGGDRLAAWLMGRYWPPCAVLWSREAYSRTGGWDELALVNNDGDIVLRAMIEEVPFVETAYGSAFYRRLPGGRTSLSDARFSREGIRAGIRVLVKLAGMLEERGRLDGYREAFDVAFGRIASECGQVNQDLRGLCESYRTRYGETALRREARARVRAARRWSRRGRRVLAGAPPPRDDAPSTPGDAGGPPSEIRYGLEGRRDPTAAAPGPGGSDAAASRRAPPPPTVSVVIPTYNRSRLVARALRSAQAQSLGDIEVLVVDDGSTDDTEAVVRGSGDPRVRYLRQAENQGVSAARNRGLRAARGDFIAFLDSDDQWMPDKLARQVEVFRASGGDVGLVYTGVRSVTPDGSEWVFRPEHRGDVYLVLLEFNPVHSGSSVMIRRNVVRTVGFFDEGIPAIEDFDYWLRVARLYRFGFVEDPLVVYHDGERDDRKSLHVGDNLAARDWLFRKHRREMRRAGVAHRFLMESARRHLRRGERASDAFRARWLAARAVWTAPGQVEAHAGLIRLMVPARIRKLPRGLGERLWEGGEGDPGRAPEPT